MEEFIYKYSSAPKRFVKEFFDIEDKYKCGEKFVDLDIISKWLKLDSDKIKEIVLDKFESETEYIESNDKSPFKISTNVFKELCMIVATDRAKQMRKYYMSIEKIINNYDNILNPREIYEKENHEYTFHIPLYIIYIVIILIYYIVIYFLKK